MPLNDPTPRATVREPRMRALVSASTTANQDAIAPQPGTFLPGCISFSVSSNSFYHADTFKAQFVLDADPAFPRTWWGAQTQIIIDIQASLDGGRSWKSLIISEVDSVSVHPVKGLVMIDGRDLTARLVDAKTRETFQNKTASQVAQILADRHGLQAVITPTTALVGRYYGQDHDRITLGQFARTTTEWDLLVSYAEHEQFDVFVKGMTLYFQPRVSLDSADPYLVRWSDDPQCNVTDLIMDRSLTVAKDVLVAVRSWSSKHQTGFTVYSPNALKIGQVASGHAQEFSFVVPNMTKQEAQDFANKKREEITQQERVIHFTAPADLTLDPRTPIAVDGTGTSWDQKYYTDSITRTMSLQGGFVMDVRAKNHSPETSVTAA